MHVIGQPAPLSRFAECSRKVTATIDIREDLFNYLFASNCDEFEECLVTRAVSLSALISLHKASTKMASFTGVLSSLSEVQI